MRKKKRLTKKRKREIRRNLLILLFVSVILCICVLGYRIYTGYEDTKLEEQSMMTSYETLARNPYLESNISMNGIYASYEDENYTSIQGIDVSSHNGTIDWARVKEAGIRFAMIRCGYRGYDQGMIQEDTQFETNYEGALENGIQIGVYFFSQAVDAEEAAEEADFVISRLSGKVLDLPVVFDMEIPDAASRVAALSREEKTRSAVTFMNRIQDAGYESMIYASSQQMNAIFDLNYLQDYSFWIAEYDVNWPDYAYMFSMWQYSNSGEIDGIDEKVDMDILIEKK